MPPSPIAVSHRRPLVAATDRPSSKSCTYNGSTLTFCQGTRAGSGRSLVGPRGDHTTPADFVSALEHSPDGVAGSRSLTRMITALIAAGRTADAARIADEAFIRDLDTPEIHGYKPEFGYRVYTQKAIEMYRPAAGSANNGQPPSVVRGESTSGSTSVSATQPPPRARRLRLLRPCRR